MLFLVYLRSPSVKARPITAEEFPQLAAGAIIIVDKCQIRTLGVLLG